MADSANEGSLGQHNNGSGLFIGRDNHGPIRIETLDPKTKAALTKLAKDAPGLARVVKKALDDGVISPDIVEALQSAVRNINEDVASSLMLAGRNINEDVASSLMLAGRNINNDVADNIFRAANTLSEATDRLDYVSSSLDRTVEKINGGHLVKLGGTLTRAAERIERVFTPPPPEMIPDRMGKFKMLLLGIAIGVVGLLIYHAFRPF